MMRIRTGLLAALMVTLLTGCREEQLTTHISDLELMDKLNEANDLTQAVAEGACVSCQYDEVLLGYVSMDIYSPDEYQMYGYDDEGMISYTYDGEDVFYMELYYLDDIRIIELFDKEQKDEYRLYMEVLRDFYLYNEGDVLTSRKEENGILYLTIDSTLSDSNKAMFADRGVDPDKITRIYEESMYDASTLRLMELTYYCEVDGEAVAISSARLNFEASIDQELKAEHENNFFGGETQHTVNIVVGTGTENEQTYSLTANEDVWIDNRLLSSEGGMDVYTDRECTQLYNYSHSAAGYVFIGCEEDVTLYMK